MDAMAQIRAVATDANGQSSERSRPSINVPEPGFGIALCASVGFLFLTPRVRKFDSAKQEDESHFRE